MLEINVLNEVRTEIYELKSETAELLYFKKKLQQELADGRLVVTRKVMDMYGHKTKIEPSKEKIEIQVELGKGKGVTWNAITNGSYYIQTNENEYTQINEENYKNFVNEEEHSYKYIGVWNNTYKGKTYGMRYHYPTIDILNEIENKIKECNQQFERYLDRIDDIKNNILEFMIRMNTYNE